MKILKKFIKKNLFYFMAFIVPIVCILFILLSKGYIINKTLFRSDMLAQYVPFFNYYKNLLLGKSSLIYEFSNGLGGNTLGVFSYYLSSPLNLIILLFSKKQLPIFIVTLLFIKIGLSSLNMYIYLINYNSKNKKMALALSISYSMMAYVITYYFHIMWLDGVYLLPLVMLGIDKIIKGRKPILYSLTLFLSIWSNYYIGYMICIFSCIYFLYKFILNYKENIGYNKKILFRFLFVSFLSGLMCFLLILPTFIDLQNSSKATLSFFNSKISINLNIFDFLSKGYIGSYNNSMILNEKTVNWYVGILPVVLVVSYFLNKNITKKEKILSFSIILLFIISFSVSHINLIWHGFNSPVCFNYRYSFIFCFFIIFLAYKGYNNLSLTKVKVLISILIYTLLSLITEFMNYQYIKNYLLWISVGLFILYIVILYLNDKISFNQKKY